MGRWDNEMEEQRESWLSRHQVGIVFVSMFTTVIGGMIFIGLSNQVVVGTYQTKVTSIFLYDGSTACGFTIHENNDYGLPCPYKLGDSITVVKMIDGRYHIKGVGGY